MYAKDSTRMKYSCVYHIPMKDTMLMTVSNATTELISQRFDIALWYRSTYSIHILLKI